MGCRRNASNVFDRASFHGKIATALLVEVDPSDIRVQDSYGWFLA
jgi:hypothetical protein